MTPNRTPRQAVGCAAVAAGGALAFLIGSAAMAEPGWVANERGAVRLVSSVTAVGAERTILVGIEFRLNPRWKTYWRLPGESGIPPRLDWSGSVNVANAEIIWPAPSRFTIAGMQTYGYAGRVILPIRIELARPGAAASLRLALRYALCHEVCVPEEAELALDVPEGAAEATPHAVDIAEFLGQAAQPGERFGWKIKRAAFTTSGEGADRRVDLIVEAASDGEPFTKPHLVAEGAGDQRFGLSSASIGADGRHVRFVLPYLGPGKDAEAAPLTLSLIDGPRCGTFAVRAAHSTY